MVENFGNVRVPSVRKGQWERKAKANLPPSKGQVNSTRTFSVNIPTCALYAGGAYPPPKKKDGANKKDQTHQTTFTLQDGCRSRVLYTVDEGQNRTVRQILHSALPRPWGAPGRFICPAAQHRVH